MWNLEGKTVLDPCWWGDRMNVSHREFWFLSLHRQWIIHVYIIHVFTFLSIITIIIFEIHLVIQLLRLGKLFSFSSNKKNSNYIIALLLGYVLWNLFCNNSHKTLLGHVIIKYCGKYLIFNSTCFILKLLRYSTDCNLQSVRKTFLDFINLFYSQSKPQFFVQSPQRRSKYPNRRISEGKN